MRILSEINVIASIALMLIFMIFGSIAFIPGILVTVTGEYADRRDLIFLNR